ncbi:hypothetical protein MSAN_00685200 [Mycena sanguinolenta]|uniref:Uncharacterized protein n=1 Tax=Mycena sanguinolenta TaxID=230812 RepID=A0A8H6Z552_9AGAR|nr:hypothetical protein MSAN_00685200 [Mycena sanguinolenta]
MIVDKVLDPQPNADAPPTYEASVVAPVHTSSSSPIRVAASGRGLGRLGASGLISPKTPVATPWFFPSSTAKHVRTTVLGLVRDLVKHQPAVAISILKSCVDASLKGTPPFYWAIIKRPTESKEEDGNLDLLTALLALSSPLTPATMSDVRLACLLMSDQALFQQLRTSEFAPMSATDQILLDATMAPDAIAVEDMPGDLGAFAVDFEIARFQKRMQVSNSIVLEFIARGRMWRLSFNVSTQDRIRHPPRGTWYVALSLLEQSPATYVDSRLLVSAPPDADTKQQQLFGGKPRPRPTLSVRIKANEQLYVRRGGRRNEIIVPLDGASGMDTLQYAGCPYIYGDETLQGRLEVRLVRPQAECIIS